MKILLIKRGALGDILMATPLIRQIKQSFPDCQLDFLIANSFKVILENNPYIDNLIGLEGKLFTLKYLPILLKRLIKFRNTYDYIFVLDKHYYFSFLAFIIGGRKRIGFVRDFVANIFLTNKVRYKDLDRYQTLYYLDLLLVSKLATPNYDDINLDFFILPENRIEVDKWLLENNLTEFIVVTNSGGNNEYETSGIRMLPSDKIAELLKILIKKNKVLLVGSSIDFINYNYYTEMIKDTNLLNLAGKFSLQQTAYLLKKAEKIFTTDCGIMHLAISQQLNKKLICFFGPTNPAHVLPQGEIVFYWQDQDIFDKNYQLFGKISNNKKCFRKLDVKSFLLNKI